MKRLLTAAVLAPLLWSLIQYAPDWAFQLVVAAVIGTVLWECYSMLRASGATPLRWLGLISGWAVAVSFLDLPGYRVDLGLALTGSTILTLIFAMSTRERPREMLDSSMATLLPVLLIGLGLAHLIGLRGLGESLGRNLVYLLCLCVMLADTAAYYVGSAIGKHPMAPRLSPKKSWEGAIAALIAAIGAALLARVWFFPALTVTEALIAGALLGPAGILGDLAESVFKRATNVKDSSQLLPGHGGLFDRTDSLLFAAPVLYYFAVLASIGTP